MLKLLSTFLSLLVLLGSSGISYSQHFCGGQEVRAEVTVGHKDISCGMPMDEDGCCKDHHTKVKTDDNYSSTTFNFQFDNNLETLIPQTEIEYLFVEFSQNIQFYVDYSPPPLEEDLNILYSTFLI